MGSRTQTNRMDDNSPTLRLLTVIVPATQQDLTVTINLETTTADQFTQLIKERVPPEQTNGALFLSYLDREYILEGDRTLSSYLFLTKPKALIFYKKRPELITVYFAKQFYVDEEIAVGNLLPTLHCLTRTNDWLDFNETTFIQNSGDPHAPPGSLSKKDWATQGFVPLDDRTLVSELRDRNPLIQLYVSSEDHVLLASEPTPTAQYLNNPEFNLSARKPKDTQQVSLIRSKSISPRHRKDELLVPKRTEEKEKEKSSKKEEKDKKKSSRPKFR